MNINGTPIPEVVVQGTPNFVLQAESDTTVLVGVRAVYCVTSGNLVVTNSADVDVTIAMTAGQTIPISPKKLKVASTGTYVFLY